MFDYVIVGAGAAGCVLAHRLSADPDLSVLLIEEGGRGRDPRLAIPRAFYYTMKSPRHTLRYPATVAPRGITEAWLRGRGLGGSTLINGLMYVRGDETAFTDLEAVAGPGWGQTDFTRAYEQMEQGSLTVTIPDSGDEVSEAILAAAASSGMRRVADVNRADGSRIGYSPATTHRGRRVSAASAFLRPARTRPNLTVATDARAERIELSADKVTGLVVCTGQRRETVSVGRELIVAAGTIESPQLLERSGIGGPDVLRAAGIGQIVDSPRVGEGVIEHRGLSVQVRFGDARGLTERLNARPRQVREGLRYLATRRGPIATSGYDIVSSFAASTGASTPDAHGIWVPMAIDETAEDLRLAPYSGLLFTGYATRPTTTSSIHVTSPDPARLPVIDAHYLEHAEERAVTAAILTHARTMISASTLAPHIASEVFPGPGIGSDAEVVEHARAHGGGVYHAVGSCAMGTDEASVVDSDLRVRGVDGLRVVDASVLPFHVSGNTAAPVMALAWLAAERLM